ncbi:hypothetical protein [Okeania sp. SIO1I7]|nr:hypothetical protein [Okeania sp. SIO1I7]
MVTSKLPMFITYIDEKKLKFHVCQEGQITDYFVIPQRKVIS